MIVLDTHVWVWWVHDDPQLTEPYRAYVQAQEADGLGLSITSHSNRSLALATSRLRQVAGLSGGGEHARRFERATTQGLILQDVRVEGLKGRCLATIDV